MSVDELTSRAKVEFQRTQREMRFFERSHHWTGLSIPIQSIGFESGMASIRGGVPVLASIKGETSWIDESPAEELYSRSAQMNPQTPLRRRCGLG